MQITVDTSKQMEVLTDGHFEADDASLPMIDICFPVPSEHLLMTSSSFSSSSSFTSGGGGHLSSDILDEDEENQTEVDVGVKSEAQGGGDSERGQQASLVPLAVETDNSIAAAQIAKYVSKMSTAIWLGEDERVGTINSKSRSSTTSTSTTVGLAVLVHIRGSWLRTMGFGSHGRDYLYPEEALHLLREEKLLLFRNPPGLDVNMGMASGAGADSGSADGIRGDGCLQLHTLVPGVRPGATLFTADSFLEVIVSGGYVPLPCLLAYNKLKRLDYIVQRHVGHGASHPDPFPVRLPSVLLSSTTLKGKGEKGNSEVTTATSVAAAVAVDSLDMWVQSTVERPAAFTVLTDGDGDSDGDYNSSSCSSRNSSSSNRNSSGVGSGCPLASLSTSVSTSVDKFISFNVFVNGAAVGWTKRGASDGSCLPRAHVVVTTGQLVPHPQLLRSLLELGMPSSSSSSSSSWLAQQRRSKALSSPPPPPPPVPLYMLVVSPTTHYVALEEIGFAAPPLPRAPLTHHHQRQRASDKHQAVSVGYLDLDNTAIITTTEAVACKRPSRLSSWSNHPQRYYHQQQPQEAGWKRKRNI